MHDQTDRKVDQGASGESPAASADAMKPTPDRRRRGWIWAVAAIVAVLVGGIVLYEEVIEEYYLVTRPGVVEEGLVFRSGRIPSAVVRGYFEQNDIQRVVSLLGDEQGNVDQEVEIATAAEMGIDYHRYGLSGDGTGSIEQYVKTIAVIHASVEEGTPVLVHCSAGTHRTGAAIAFYRMLVQGWPADQAAAEMKQYGWHPQRDAVLVEYMNEHMAALADRLVEEGVLAAAPSPPPLA